MIFKNVNFINITLVFAAIIIFPSLTWAQGTFNNVQTQEQEISIGSQTFDFSSPKSALEKRDLTLEGSFPKVITDRPVNPDEYQVGVGDVFILISQGKIKTQTLLTVGPEGKVILPDVGDITISGMTITKAKEKISAKMRTRYRRLQFHLLLAEPRSFKVYVLGEVNKPGIYVLNALNKVADAISMADGIKNSGSTRKVELRRGKKVLHADLYLFQKKGKIEENPDLLENDIVFVPLSMDKVTIGGGVRRPGVYELEGDEDLKHLLERIGGFTSKANISRDAEIIRLTGRGDKKTLRVDLEKMMNGEEQSPRLSDGDNIYIPTVEEAPAEETNVYVTGEVMKPGAYPYKPGYTSKIYVSMAGGLTVRARYSQAEIVKADGTKLRLADNPVIEIGDTIHVPEKFIKVWQDCLVITTSISSLTLAVIAAFK